MMNENKLEETGNLIKRFGTENLRPRRINGMWYLIAFGLSMIVPSNGVFLSLWHGLFGRLYIVYWVIVYHEMWMHFFKNLVNT